MEQVSPWILIGFNVLLGLVSVFGSLWLRRMETDVEQLRKTQIDHAEKASVAERVLHDKLNGYVAKEDFREFRQELREDLKSNFDEVFRKIDQINGRRSVDQASPGGRN